MARQTISAALLAFLGVSTAEFTDRSDFLRDLYNGKVSKSQVELVLAQHNEDIAWSDPLKSVRTVYCKGSNCGTDSIVLPNVGREGQTFLHHIVQNYDRLSDWTVFSQAEAPTEGYFGHKNGGGHMLSGSHIDDYLAHHHETGGKDDAFFLMSSKVHLGTLRHALRSSFKVSDGANAPQISEASAVCPKDKGSQETEDVWGNYHNVPMLKSFLEKKCGVEAVALSAAMTTFWEDFVQLPVPENEVVYYAQGARFAVSRERLQQRSKAYYQALLDGVSGDVDPCLNYLYEMSWYYMAGKPTSSPCSGNDEDVAVADNSQARFLQTGVSGEEGEPEPLEAVVVETTMEVSAEEATDMATNQTKLDQLAAGLADTLEGVDPDWIDVTVTVSSGRRLQSGTVTVTVSYTITIPETSTISASSVAATTNGSTFKDTLQSAVSASTGLTITVSSASGSAGTVTVTSTTTTTKAPSESGCTRSTAVGGATAVLAAFLF